MADTGDKKGKELFLELLRLLPSSQVEDYYTLGRWNDADLQLDFDLLDAHRREAGAEDPPSLEELEVPPMPGDRKPVPVLGVTAYQRPVAAAGVGPGALPRPQIPRASGVTPIVQRAQPLTGLRPQQPKSAPPSGIMAAGVAGGPSAELRQIALFIAKWKLEATKTKLLLARLTPPRRRWVMSNFTQSAGGLSSTAQLEQYIARCERTNAWGAAGGAVSPAVAARPVTGLKRPLTSSVAFDPNKRAKIGVSAAMPPRAGVSAMSIRPGVTAYGRSAPAWLGASAASVGRIPVGGGYRPQPVMAQRPAIGGYGVPAARPGGYPKPAGVAARPLGYAARPAAPKYGGTIKPAAKAGKGGARPGSLIQNLLRM